MSIKARGNTASRAMMVWRRFPTRGLIDLAPLLRHCGEIGMGNTTNAAQTRLATYGTLAPGRVNNHQLAGLNGRWLQGTVRGRLVEAGWGADLGYPGLILDPSEQPVDVHVFESSDLPGHWPRLDAFEGEGYRRVSTLAGTDGGDLAVSIYVIDV